MQQLLFHCIPDVVRDLALQIARNATVLSRLSEALCVLADVCTASRLSPLEVKGDRALRITNHAKQLALRRMSVASEALTLGDFTFLLFHLLLLFLQSSFRESFEAVSQEVNPIGISLP